MKFQNLFSGGKLEKNSKMLTAEIFTPQAKHEPPVDLSGNLLDEWKQC